MPEALVHGVREVPARLEFPGDAAGQGVGLHHKQRLGGDIGHGQGLGMLFIGQRAGLVAVQIQRPDPDGPDVEGEPKDGPHPRLDGGGGEGQPAGRDAGRDGGG